MPSTMTPATDRDDVQGLRIVRMVILAGPAAAVDAGHVKRMRENPTTNGSKDSVMGCVDYPIASRH
jgi:hypothetical protein